jgi:hypothetical protein
MLFQVDNFQLLLLWWLDMWGCFVLGWRWLLDMWGCFVPGWKWLLDTCLIDTLLQWFLRLKLWVYKERRWG